MDGAPLAKDTDWLPAVEQFGEGIFIRLDQGAIEGWLQRDQWSELRGGDGRHQRSLAYGVLHSLSHALMAEIALVCGYPASAPTARGLFKRSGLCRSRTELKE